MNYFLGLDIGGTKTACVLADEHGELSRAQAGSAKVLRIGKAEAAHDGDRIAQGTLERGGYELAGLVLHVIGRLAAKEPGIENGLKVAGTGSVWKHVPEVSAAMRQRLLKTYPKLVFPPDAVDPLEGTLWHARRLGAS